MSRKPDLMTYLPPLYEQVVEMKLLARTEGEELGQLLDGVDSVLDQFYPESATWALARYEQDLHIPVNPLKPADQRRSVIISKMRGSGKVSGSMLRNVAQAYESGGIEVSVLPGEYAILIRFVDTYGLPPNLDDLKAAIEEIKPAHMSVEFHLRYLTIAEVESMTLSEIEQTRQDKFMGGGA
ncbi:putative phage tail protein [Paenibacillus sp. FSL W8-0426]|uniref:putative phage tail protein n=1 Tax=Paenibacillus sp. FSL W8-0426 TaxID=2921714 RepID=UPI0030DA0B3F